MKTAAAVLFLTILCSADAAETQYLAYDTFIRQVEGGNVKSVTLGERSQIEGLLVSGSVTNGFHSFTQKGAADDPLLNRFLKEHGVQITVGPVSGPDTTMPVVLGTMTLVLPLLFLFLLLVIVRKLDRVLKHQEANQDAGPAVRR